MNVIFLYESQMDHKTYWNLKKKIFEEDENISKEIFQRVNNGKKKSEKNSI